MENARKRRGVNLDELQARGRYDAELLVAVKTNKRNLHHAPWDGEPGIGREEGEAFQLCIRSELRKGSWRCSMLSFKKITIPHRQFNCFVRLPIEILKRLSDADECY